MLNTHTKGEEEGGGYKGLLKISYFIHELPHYFFQALL